MKKQIQLHIMLTVFCLVLSGCNKSKLKREIVQEEVKKDKAEKDRAGKNKTETNSSSRSGESASVKIPSVDVVREYYESNKEFFQVKTAADIPADLDWEDGSNLPVFASIKAKRGGTFHTFMNDFPRTLRYVGPDASGSFRRHILDHNVITLVQRHPNVYGYYPGLAREWAFSKDKKTVYFRLDPDAHYSDGKPVKVTDFFFHFYFMQSPHIKAPWYNDHYSDEKFKRITIYDEETLSLTYYKAKPDVIEKVNIRPVPEHFYRELDQKFMGDYQMKFEPTTGSYEVLLENVVKGDSIILTRVANWWADEKKFYKNRFNPDAIKVSVISEPSKAMAVFKTGGLDLHGLGLPEYWYDKLPNDAPAVQKGYIHKVKFFNVVPRPTWGVRVNSSKPMLRDRNIRLGLQHAMNFEEVIKQVFRGDYDRMNSVADGYGPQSHPMLKARKFSVQQATAYFAKAGFIRRGSDGILVNDQNQRLAFTFTTAYKRLENVMTVLKEEAKKAGVDLDLEIMEQTAAWKKVDEKKHELALAALNTSVELYPRFWEPYHSDNSYEEPKEQRYNDDGSLRDGLTPKPTTNNFTLCADKAIDDIIEKYREEEDLAKIRQMSHDLIQRLHDYGAYIPGWKRPWYRAGHWRWVQWPEGYNLKESREPIEFQVHWIDTKLKSETLDAMKNGGVFPQVIKEYDQYKID